MEKIIKKYGKIPENFLGKSTGIVKFLKFIILITLGILAFVPMCLVGLGTGIFKGMKPVFKIFQRIPSTICDGSRIKAIVLLPIGLIIFPVTMAIAIITGAFKKS